MKNARLLSVTEKHIYQVIKPIDFVKAQKSWTEWSWDYKLLYFSADLFRGLCLEALKAALLLTVRLHSEGAVGRISPKGMAPSTGSQPQGHLLSLMAAAICGFRHAASHS